MQPEQQRHGVFVIMRMLNRHFLPACRQRGMTLVELMVGIAVGLFVVAGATKLLVDNLINNRRLLVETRVNQDLRSAADLIARDLRRAGYWRNSGDVGIGTSTLNPYSAIANTTTDLTTGELTYTYDRDGNSATNDVDQGGFRVNAGTLEMLNGANGWQAVTDIGSMQIVAPATLTVTTKSVNLSASCPCLSALTCKANSFLDPDPDTGATGVNYANRPQVSVREYDLRLTGRAPSDTNVTRSIRETVRVRNDEPSGGCPT
jgi:prepilin peptidase dependent protein B